MSEVSRSFGSSRAPRAAPLVTLSASAFRLLLLIVVSASALAQLWTHSEHFTFEYENDWLLGLSRRLGERFELHSSPIGPTGFDHGPLFFLLVWPVVSLLPDPMALHVVWVGLASVGALVVGLALERQVGSAPALLAVTGLTTSWFWFDSSRALWHSSLLPLPMALFLAALLAYVHDGRVRSLTGAGIAAAVCVQLHAQSAYLGLMFILTLGWTLPKRGLRHVLLPVLATAVAMSPILLSAAARWTSMNPQSAADVPNTGTALAAGFTWASAALRMASPAASGDTASVAGSLWLLLAGVGVVVAMARREPRMVVLAASVILGLVSSAFLLGWGAAPRYLHTLALPTFAVASVAVSEGLELLVRRRRASGLLAGQLIVVASVAGAIVASMTAANPGFRPPLLNAESQSLLAAELRRVTSDRDRIHGVDDSDRSTLTGTGYFFGLPWPDAAAPLPDGEALVVLPSSLEVPVPRPVSVVRLATTPTGLLVFRSRPRARLTGVTGREPARVFGSDVLDVRQMDEAPHFVISGEVSGAGPIVLQLRRAGLSTVCPVQATLSGRTLEARPLLSSAGFEYLLITAPNAGPLSLHVGPCPGEVQVDAF